MQRSHKTDVQYNCTLRVVVQENFQSLIFVLLPVAVYIT
jgi:hypothetical protein